MCEGLAGERGGGGRGALLGISDGACCQLISMLHHRRYAYLTEAALRRFYCLEFLYRDYV